MEKSASEDDRVFDIDEFKVVINKEYDGFYKKIKIDWVNGFLNKGFKVYDTGNRGC